MPSQPQALFAVALGLTPPWRVVRVELDAPDHRLDIWLDFERGTRFPCPACGAADAPVYDTEDHEWRHLNFFQYQAYLHARVPRVRCPVCGKVTKIHVPWARNNGGFTVLFEAFLMLLFQQMPVKAVGDLVGEHDTRLWRVLHHYVEVGHQKQDFSGICQVAVDETASRRGQQYVRVFADADTGQVLFATEGRDASTVKAFAEDLAAHGGDPARVSQFTADLSPAFTAGIQEHFPEADITYDRFHLIKLANEAVDEVRRQENRHQPQLRGTRYLWLKNHLTARQQAQREDLLSQQYLKTARAFRLKLALQGFYEQPDLRHAQDHLGAWYYWAVRSRLQPMRRLAHTIRDHWEGIVNGYRTRLNTGRMEGLNSMVQAAKARARGYRTTRNLIAMIHLLGAKLNYGLPQLST